MVKLAMRIDPMVTLIAVVAATSLGYTALSPSGEFGETVAAARHADCRSCQLPRHTSSGQYSRAGPDPRSCAVETVTCDDGTSYLRRMPLGTESKGTSARTDLSSDVCLSTGERFSLGWTIVDETIDGPRPDRGGKEAGGLTGLRFVPVRTRER